MDGLSVWSWQLSQRYIFTGTVSGTLGIVSLVLGVVFALTAAVSICPLYLPFGLSTRS